jgi:hypothetical protein
MHTDHDDAELHHRDGKEKEKLSTLLLKEELSRLSRYLVLLTR